MISVRLFVAIFPPPEIQKALAASTSGLRVGGDARWIRPENIHLTLKFLGEVSETAADEISDALRKSAEKHSPFELSPSGFGAFPSERRARVIWAGADAGLEPLRALAEDIESSLEPLGFGRENRGFSPHLTLGRAKKRPVKVEVAHEAEIPGFEAKEIHLVKSETKKEGAVYTPLETFRLSPPKS